MSNAYGRQPSLYTVFGPAAATANIKTGGARLRAFTVTNRNSSVRYLQFYDSTSATTTVKFQFVIPATTGQVGLGDNFFVDGGIGFTTGLTYGFSTTAGSYVAATSTEHDLQVIYT